MRRRPHRAARATHGHGRGLLSSRGGDPQCQWGQQKEEWAELVLGGKEALGHLQGQMHWRTERWARGQWAPEKRQQRRGGERGMGLGGENREVF